MTREEYDGLHKYCPACGRQEFETTCMAIFAEDFKTVRDNNRVKCLCGWKGTRHEMTGTKYNPDEISVNTLKMLDSSMKNFAKGIAGKSIDIKELKTLADKFLNEGKPC